MLPGWFMRLFRRKELPPVEHMEPLHDANYAAAHLQYQQEKEDLYRRHLDRLARVQRLGYDLSIVTRRPVE